jgi:cytochrome c6
VIRRPRWVNGAFVAFAVPALLVGFASIALAASPAPQQGGASLPGDPDKGAQVYTSNCATCHGSSLEGSVGPRLHPIEKLPDAPNGDALDPNYLVDTITNGKQGVGNCSQCSGTMPSWGGKLSADDIKNVSAYIIQMNQEKGPIPLSAGDLAKSNVTWVTIGILAMLAFTYLLARYNMRWIARKQVHRRRG